MKSAALPTDKRSLKMDSQNLGTRLIRFVLLGDVGGDSFDRTESLIGAGCDSGGNERRGAIFRDLAGDRAKRGASSFHDVVAASAMNVHINESRNGRLVRSANFLRSRRQGHSRTWPDGLNGVIANQDPRIVYLYCRGKRTAGVNEKGRHGSNNIVTETLRSAKTKRAPYRDARHEKREGFTWLRRRPCRRWSA